MHFYTDDELDVSMELKFLKYARDRLPGLLGK